MDYKTLVENTLKTAITPVPLAFQHYGGLAAQYVTYFCYNEQGEAWADNKEIAAGCYLQIDIWSKTSDCETLAGKIKTALIAARFDGYTAQDLFETDTKIYHKAIRVNYV